MYKIIIKEGIPIFNDNPPWVVRKLVWNPRQPVTPPPTSMKFLESSWKNDCLTRRHPLCSTSKSLIKTTSSKQWPKHLQKEQCQVEFSRHWYLIYLLEAFCLKIISKTLNASWVASDTFPFRAKAMVLKGIFAANLIWTINVLEKCKHFDRLRLSFSLGLPLLTTLQTMEKIVLRVVSTRGWEKKNTWQRRKQQCKKQKQEQKIYTFFVMLLQEPPWIQSYFASVDLLWTSFPLHRKQNAYPEAQNCKFDRACQ